MELDLQRLKDDAVVIYHDFLIPGPGGRPLPLRGLNLKEVRSLRPDILTFQEFARLYEKKNVAINLEIKDDVKTLTLIKERLQKFTAPLISSFNHEVVDAAIRAGYRGAYLIRNLRQKPRRSLTNRLHIPAPERAGDLEGLGEFALYVFTVNDPEMASALQADGITRGIFTDNQEMLHISN